MSKQDYITRADGWIAGKWRAGGSTVSLTAAEAKYENVTLKSDDAEKAVPSIDQDQKGSKSAVDDSKRSRDRK